VKRGNTVVVIEHNLDVIKCCDWVIDLGPDGGDKGGKIVAKGTPADIADSKASETGSYLKKVLKIKDVGKTSVNKKAATPKKRVRKK